MKNIFIVFSLFLFVLNCGGFEFVYKTNINDFLIKDLTDLSVSGDNASDVYGILNNKMGDKEDNFPNFKLLVKSIKDETAVVVKKDATASKYNIEFTNTALRGPRWIFDKNT